MVAVQSTATKVTDERGRRDRRRRRGAVASYLVMVFALVTLNFLLPRTMPGDPIDALLALGSPNYVNDDETRANLAE